MKCHRNISLICKVADKFTYISGNGRGIVHLLIVVRNIYLNCRWADKIYLICQNGREIVTFVVGGMCLAGLDTGKTLKHLK